MVKHRIRLADVTKRSRLPRISKRKQAQLDLYKNRAMAIVFLWYEHCQGKSFSKLYIPSLIKAWLDEMPQLASNPVCEMQIEEMMYVLNAEAHRSARLDVKSQSARGSSEPPEAQAVG